MKSTILTSILSASTASAYSWTHPTDHLAPRQAGITWSPCFDNPNIECGNFEVPLDYADSLVGKASLAVIRYKATQPTKMGSIFINPGGPGISGIHFIAGGKGEVISQIAGGYYDIVSWDPRGVGDSQPRIDCFSSASEEAAFWEGTILHNGLEARGNFTERADLEFFYSQVNEVDLKLVQLGEKCNTMSGGHLKYVGTAAVVRDMVAMADYLEGPDKPINFWGFSYGTIVGTYFVNMFPGRVGRCIIDGVVNPVYWAQLPAHLHWGDSITSADEALEGFALACSQAGPTGCALALEGSTPISILAWIRALIDKAYNHYHTGGTDLKSSIVRSYIHNQMYRPTGWVDMAEALLQTDQQVTEAHSGVGGAKDAFKRIAKRYEEQQLASGKLKRRQDGTAPDYSNQAITCADAVDAPEVTTQVMFDELVRVTREVSGFFGPFWGGAGLYCHRWPARAVERFQGPWNHTLANPILVIGNEGDPITPYASAKFVADGLGDSATLIEQDDYGHCSLAMHSTCTIDIIGNYFINGAMPSQDQFCGTNQVLFPGVGQ